MNVFKDHRRWAALGALAFGALVLARPQAAATGFAGGTALCLQSVLPALFPFFVVCELLTAAPPPAALLRPVQKVLGLASSETARAVLLSWVGGYAVCAKLTGQLYGSGHITKRDAVLLQVLGCCSGPGFVVGCVGGLLLGNVHLGMVLYSAQIGANLVCACILVGADACIRPGGAADFSKKGMPRRTGGRMRASAPTDGVTMNLPAAISSAVTSSLSVCGCVVFFRVVGAVLPLRGAWVSALLEVSAGCADFAAVSGQTALYGCCGCLSLLGVSVWAQMQLFSGKAFCPRVLLFSRAVHFLLLQGIVRLCVRFLPGAVTACSSLSARVVPVFRLPPDAAAAGFVFLCAALYKLRQNLYNE